MNNNTPSQLPPAPIFPTNNPEDGVIPLPATSLCGAGDITTVKPPVESDPAETTFPTFPDSSFFKFLERKGFEPQCLLVAADGQQVAITKNAEVADLICNALNLFLLASLRAQSEGQQIQIVTKPVIIP